MSEKNEVNEMAKGQSSKQIVMKILDVMRRYSDDNHRLSQKDIADILRNEYGITVDRKAVRRNLLSLIEYGYEIEYSESVRMVPNPDTGELEEHYLWTDFYLVRDFTDPELRLLIDGLLFSKHIPYSQCKELVGKLEKLSSKYFSAHVKHVYTMPDTLPQNKQLFLTIETLDEAITKKRKVACHYIEYGTDKKPHVKRRENGTVREYILSPYQMAAKEGKYYLICNYDKFNDVSNYRIDRITDVRILDEPAKPYESLDWSGKEPLDLAEYMAEHVYMYSSKTSRAVFRVKREMISDVLDMFGTGVTFSAENGEYVTVSAKVNEGAMYQFAKNFSPDVVVLEPQSIAKRLRDDALRTLEVYEGIE